MRKLTKPYFITLEGIEGSGKTSQITSITSFLTSKGEPAISTREPGGTELANRMRKILVEPHKEPLQPMAELLLYNAARVQHVSQVIRPTLNAQQSVVCDRYIDATVAYQSYGRGLPLGTVTQINDWASDGLIPDLTFLLDCPPAAGLARSQARLDQESSNEGRFEAEELAFHERVRQAYLDIADRQKDRFVLIDATQAQEEVTTQILTELEKRIE